MNSATLKPLDYDLNLIPTIHISPSKNSTLPLLAASLLIEGITLLEIDDDHIDDIKTMIIILSKLGAHCIQEKDQLIIDARGPIHSEAVFKECSDTRYSLLLLGILSSRTGSAKVSIPGGCDLNRPFDYHVDCLTKLGNSISHDDYEISCSKGSALITTLELPYPSVGTTLQALFSCVTGTTNSTIHIQNTALEPEIDDVISFLNKAGTKILRNGSDLIVVPVNNKTLRGIKHKPIDDRIEASSYAFASMAARKLVLLKNYPIQFMAEPLHILDQLKCPYYLLGAGDILIDGRAFNDRQPLDVTALPYPGFPTDLQPILTALCCTLDSKHIVRDMVMPSRTNYVNELRKIGADISCFENTISINGFKKKSNQVSINVSAPDLRGGMAIVLLAISCGCQINITAFNQILRGYSRIISNAQILGGQITYDHTSTDRAN
ncbi:hypothetical protein [Pseudomonas putida]|uniref:hypothetical protein n=1 Tax=Pseudomonas putida TaxID=303 RepID=UPI0009BD80D2|nr:hypothetical protein [Pseudomonas putida]